MNAHAPITKERVTNPLFTERRSRQCAWPLWPDHPVVPLEVKRCCGAPVREGAKVPYCDTHRQQSGGVGSPSERRAARALLTLTLKHGER